MNHKSSIYLWNSLCATSFGGEWGGFERLEGMGFTALGAGLPTVLSNTRKTSPSNDIEDRKKVVEFLHDWADAITLEDE